jgi:hypothetical protein|tara:strand:- start:471 stop:671 length:201 start_codon:yes stop_codon:yes gene_type:complete
MLIRILLLLSISSCTIIFDRDKKDDKIIIEELEPIQKTKVSCDTKSLTALEVKKCEMEARLLELKY